MEGKTCFKHPYYKKTQTSQTNNYLSVKFGFALSVTIRQYL